MLIDACRLAPDDDGPRLVWADSVGGERGELVVLQCDLARDDLPPAEAAARRRREHELLQRNAVAWSGLRSYGRFEFRRGFVESLQVDLELFVTHADAILEAAPLLRNLTVDGPKATGSEPPSLDPFRALLELPAFWKLHGLGVFAAGGRFGLGDEVVALLVDAGALAQLAGLDIYGSNLSGRGVVELARSGDLSRVEQLWLRRHHCRDELLASLLREATGLRSLALTGAHSLVGIAAALPALSALYVDHVDRTGLEALAHQPAARTLRSLRLVGDRITAGAVFEPFRALVELDLYELPVTGPLWDTPPPRLRRLRLSPGIEPALVVELARSVGSQLELLDICGARLPQATRDELAALVAGEVRGGPASDVPPML